MSTAAERYGDQIRALRAAGMKQTEVARESAPRCETLLRAVLKVFLRSARSGLCQGQLKSDPFAAG